MTAVDRHDRSVVAMRLEPLGRRVHLDVSRSAAIQVYDELLVPLADPAVGSDAERREQRLAPCAAFQADILEHVADPQLSRLARLNTCERLHFLGQLVRRRQCAVTARDLHENRARARAQASRALTASTGSPPLLRNASSGIKHSP